MNNLSIFLIIIIIYCLISGCNIGKEPFLVDSLHTLRGQETKYSLTTAKNKFNYHVGSKAKKYYKEMKGKLHNFYNKWL